MRILRGRLRRFQIRAQIQLEYLADGLEHKIRDAYDFAKWAASGF